MAIVAYTTYNTDTDCQRSNIYISDGHGLANAARVNRYISDEHSQTQLLGAHRCPADPELATAYMETLRQNYERQHFIDPNRAKKAVTHVQLYISPTEVDNVPAEERMVMTQKLIDRTPLRDFASIYVPHDNRPDKHTHISLCPYSIPDEYGNTHKLGMNNTLLYALRREMDRICVEHGYSIIEAPELFGDPEYREWFLRIKETGVVKIHPPAEIDRSTFRKNKSRSRRYAASKQSQSLKQETQRTFYRKMTQGYTPETAEYYYSSPYLHSPDEPESRLHIRKRDKDGNEASDLELVAISMFCWAYQAKKNLVSRKVPGSLGLQERMASLADKAMRARQLVRELDIHTQTELITHIKECGSDIAELKQEIARQETILSRMADITTAVDRWEGEKDEDAHLWLQHHCGSREEMAKTKKAQIRAEGRKYSAQELLAARSAEYRCLKETEALIRPSASQQEWLDYVGILLGKEYQKRIGFIQEETLCRQIRTTGRAIGISPDALEQILVDLKTAAQTKPIQESDIFVKALYASDNEQVSFVYNQLRDRYQALRDLHALQNHMVVVGPFSLLLFIALCYYSGMEEIALESEIEELHQNAIAQKEYAKQYRVTKQHALSGAKKLYAIEVLTSSEDELDACRVRYFEHAATIINRADIVSDIKERKQRGELDHIIADAAYRTLLASVQQEKKSSAER